MRTVPAGWSAAPLREVCQIFSGGTPRTNVAAYWGGEIDWVTPQDLSKDRSQAINGGERRLTQAGYDSCSARIFPPGSIIVSSRAPIGYVAIAGREMCTNQGCKTAVPFDFLDPTYLYWYLVSVKSDLEDRASGTTFKEISARVFGDTVILWPELNEQRRIVDVLEDHLSRLDAGRGAALQAERRLTSLNRSALQAVLNAPDRRMVPLQRLVQRIEAGRSFGGAAAPAAPGQWGVVKASAMTWGEFKAEQNKAVPADAVNSIHEIQPGDLLLSRANTLQYVGASVLVGSVRRRLLLSDKSLRLIPREGVSRQWLWLALSAPNARMQISNRATGTKDSMRNISQAALLSIEVPCVSSDEQQADTQRLKAYLDAVTRLAASVTTVQRKQGPLRQALLGAAFSGRLTGRMSDMDLVEEMSGA